MRKLLALAVLFGFVGLGLPAQAQEKKEGPTLKVGDPAPALTASKWLQGAEVTEFAKGKTYVIEFWATWCGPCIVMMPHLADLQAQFKDKGVTVIGYTANGPNNDAEKVAAFVKKRGPKLDYTFAYADDRDTYNAWMRAAGRGGIPCTFVVDGNGKIAYIGHPMYLDVVLPKVAAGKWNVEEDGAAVKKIEEEVTAVFAALRGADADASLKTVADFEAAHPELAHIPYFTSGKLSLMLKTKRYDDAKKFAEGVIARAVKQDDPLPLGTVSAALRSQAAQEQKELVALSLTAAEAGLKITGDKDARALLTVAEAHFALGDKAKAKDYGDKAVTAAEAESVAIKRFIETQAKKFAEPEDDK